MDHIPVLLAEVVKVFEGCKLKTFFEGTLGLGGHAKALLEAHPEIERYIACDKDREALEEAKKRLKSWGKKVEYVLTPFSRMERVLEELKVEKIDGFLLDLGVSSLQLDKKERGFSFLSEASLDMRMDLEGETTAEDLVNSLPEVELARILYEYGEERRSRQIAKAIVERRRKKRIKTTLELADIVKGVVRGGKIHPATKTFQALRIAVNDELSELKKGLKAAANRLDAKGRLAVISFHSLEDRIVKWDLKEESSLKILTKKPVVASRDEVRKNPRSRSAKLRAAEKI